MKNSKPYIVIAQTHSMDINRIRAGLTGANEVYLTREPEEALAEVMRTRVDIVVTGQYFYKIDIETRQEHESLLTPENAGLKIKYYIAPSFGLYTGPVLAQQIKTVNPQIPVFRCSRKPGEIGEIFGEIEKDENLVDLLFFVNFPFLNDIARKKDWKKLKEEFPFIKFYKNPEKSRISSLEEVLKSPFSFFGLC